MITDKDKNEIKELIEEALDNEREKRNTAYFRSFIVGIYGAMIFFIAILVVFLSHFSFISGIAAGFIFAFDIWFMYILTKLPYAQAGETNEK